MPTMTVNPGSPEAIAQGCTCDASLNNDGTGWPYSDGNGATFWIDPNCPVAGHVDPENGLP